jgi:hypothetical protein
MRDHLRRRRQPVLIGSGDGHAWSAPATDMLDRLQQRWRACLIGSGDNGDQSSGYVGGYEWSVTAATRDLFQRACLICSGDGGDHTISSDNDGITHKDGYICIWMVFLRLSLPKKHKLKGKKRSRPMPRRTDGHMVAGTGKPCPVATPNSTTTSAALCMRTRHVQLCAC